MNLIISYNIGVRASVEGICLVKRDAYVPLGILQ